MYFDGERKDAILMPPKMITSLIVLMAIPSIVFGVYWEPLANWIESSLVFFIQTI
tara:strand:- start:422 stop:586 length:165 start_codon:yes stop_codon:yes gene_type:complete